jgi:DNA gyrase subunit A
MVDEIQSIKSLLIEDEMKDSYLNYAMSVIVSRALPDVRDGLKPSQRRILVAMHDLELGPRSKHRKCAKICGDTSGNYHPHGEQVVYPTLVRMAQDFASRYCLVDGQGNFGSIDSDPPAAMRYTEARMTTFAMLMMEDIDRDTVDFVPNYDETRTEPSVLPGKFPNLLCNGSSGIAVGMATSMPPHNAAEICEGVIRLIDNPDITIDELMKCIKGPDFPTGGLICGGAGIVDAYKTGRGLITVRARVHTETTKGGKKNIIVTEIPYNQSKSKIIEKIAELVKNEKIQGVSDVRDESDREGMRIVVELRRGEEEKVVINQLFEHTQLQDTFSIINLALVNKRPQTLTLKQLLTAYRDHRMEVIRRRTRFLLDKAEREEHILEGLVIALRNIDAVIETIKKSKTVAEAEASLVKKFKLSVIQAQAILQMRLQRLTGLEQDKILQDLKEIREKIADYRAILADEQLVLDIIREDAFEIKEKYGDARRTEIVGQVEKFDIEDLIAEEDMAVIISHQGYIKRMPLSSYRKQHRGGKGVLGADTKEGDFIKHLFIGSTHDYILFFTDQGRLFWQKVYDIPQLSRASKGRAVINLLNLNESEVITSAIPVRDFDERFLIMATQMGCIKKTVLKAFGNPRRGGIIAITLDKGDRLIGVNITTGKNHIVLGTREGMAIRFPEEQVRPMGRGAHGVGGVRLQKGDSVCDMIIVDETATLLAICENGFGKRTEFEEYRIQSRNGMGVINIKASDRNGKVVGLHAVHDDDDLMMLTMQGMVVRISVKSIRNCGRNTQGVKLMSVTAGDKLISTERVIKEEAPAGDEEAGDDKDDGTEEE